jgi:uncharacterized membrane protein YeiB
MATGARGALAPGLDRPLPLTIYTAHVLALALLLLHLSPGEPARGVTTWVVITVASIVFASAWRAFVGQGPIEWALRRLDGSGRPAADVQFR